MNDPRLLATQLAVHRLKKTASAVGLLKFIRGLQRDRLLGTMDPIINGYWDINGFHVFPVLADNPSHDIFVIADKSEDAWGPIKDELCPWAGTPYPTHQALLDGEIGSLQLIHLQN